MLSVFLIKETEGTWQGGHVLYELDSTRTEVSRLRGASFTSRPDAGNRKMVLMLEFNLFTSSTDYLSEKLEQKFVKSGEERTIKFISADFLPAEINVGAIKSFP